MTSHNGTTGFVDLASSADLALRELMWGSYFSFGNGCVFKNSFARVRSKISFIFGEPIPATNVSASKLQEIVGSMLVMKA